MKNLLILILCFQGFVLSAQSQQHPVIFATTDERLQILDKITNFEWAQSIVDQLHVRVDDEILTHQTNPSAILNTVPDFADNDGYSESQASSSASGHFEVLSHAAYAGMLYYLNEDEKYAQFSADILTFYIDALAPRTPQTTSICGNYFYDPRTTYPHFALAYDFIYNFLQRPETMVYNKATDTHVPFNNADAQKALANITGNALKEYGSADTHGKFISNHPVLTAPGALFPILCIDDDTERERLFNVFWTIGTNRQNSFANTILPMFGEQGIWPESLSYSFMSNISLILNVVDRIKPEMDVTVENQHIFDGVFLFENLRNPDRNFVRYGDSKRKSDGTKNNYRYVLNLAKRRGYTELQSKAEIALSQKYYTEGGRDDEISNSKFGNFSALALFWGEALPEAPVEEFDYKPTVIVKHAGIALQRNYVKNDNVDYGLCGIIGGAHYVHSHCTGIAMELYGAGYAMGPNGGLPPTVAERSLPVHSDYFRLYAGNNTLIVNGSSHGRQSGSWKGNSYLWQNTTVNVAAEPQHLEDPLSIDFSFATQLLEDRINNCDQQRTLSTIRTSATTAYYFDLFRSKSLSVNSFHDYIYHNLGDEINITNSSNEELPVTPTIRYDNDIGDPVNSPGWRFFEDTEVTAPTSDLVNIRFHIEHDDRYMHMMIPAGVEREYTKALGPPTREAKNGYLNKKTPVIAIRQQGEAWDEPYIVIFEPSLNASPAVQSVENIEVDGKVIGAEVISLVDGKEIKDFIISLDTEDSVYIAEHFISFKGRFGIVRRESLTEETETVTLYIGSGESLGYADLELLADEDMKNIETFQGVPKITPETRFTVNTQVLGGGGAISKSPDQADYPAGSQVVVTAVPEYGYVFDQWLGDAGSMYSSDTLTLFSNKNVLVKFRFAEYYTLNIASENGEVTQSEAGTEFPEQSCIELTAVADEGYEFDNWSGDVNSNDNPINICFDANKAITANFIALSSISEAFDDSVIVKPNPSNGRFRVQVSKPNSYSVFDITGKIILKGQAEGSFEVDLSSYEKAMYILNIRTNDDVAVKRIILKDTF